MAETMKTLKSKPNVKGVRRNVERRDTKRTTITSTKNSSHHGRTELIVKRNGAMRVLARTRKKQ